MTFSLWNWWAAAAQTRQMICGKGRNRTHANSGLQPLALPAELPFRVLQFRQDLNLHLWVQSPMCLPLHYRTIESVKGVEPLLQVWKTYMLVPLNTIPTILKLVSAEQWGLSQGMALPEPASSRLTAGCSTVELLFIKYYYLDFTCRYWFAIASR